ncbi:Golgi apparatus protein 1 [Dermacentor silvarum]|uniref:Golgi apparatus protein 1 n=1 Tax=Dermacentor silvarum TaxID=543639 RepID=UPI0018983365|nr:Golgi apparatus protein 1 [Dermacentor silvarum]
MAFTNGRVSVTPHSSMACWQRDAWCCVFAFLFTFVVLQHAPFACCASVGDQHDNLNNNVVPGGDSKSRRVEQPTVVKLAEDPACASELQHLCSPSQLKNNFNVLDCVQNAHRKEDEGLSNACHHLLWKYRRDITQDNRFNDAASKFCKRLMEMFPQCLPGDKGQLLACLIDHSENATEPECHTFLERMQSVVFSDYRLVYKFTDACDSDIDRFTCGRIPKISDERHSQGATLECLSRVINQLQDNCRRELLHLARLQGEDFHLDRPLFFACQEDRDRLCPHVASGEGRIYRCLLRHRSSREMSEQCREKLVQREQLTMQDFRVSQGLSGACLQDIRMYRCREKTSNRREFRLAQILLCLENAMHKDYPVGAECQQEMLEHRRFLLENYQLTPDLASSCEQDIATFCRRRLEPNGKTLHCLMRHARPSAQGSQRLSDQCRRQVEHVLKVSGAGEDWRVDPVLQEACQSTASHLCQDVKPGRGRMLSCLMDQVSNIAMKDTCREALLQIQYFVARDFKLDPVLYKECRADAVTYCKAKKEWHDDPTRMDPERGPIVLPCLYRYAYHPDDSVRLSKQCLYEIRRVMRQRAVSIDLHPEIEEPCMPDLAGMCSDHLGRGEEMQCLQDNLEKLSRDCRAAVANYTEEEAEHLELNYPLYHSCQAVLKDLCSDLLSKDVDQGDLLGCLVQHKNDFRMKEDQRCRAALEHFQLISLKDYKFSYAFKEACRKDAQTYCGNSKSGADVVSCLSKLVLDDVTDEKTPRVSSRCRQQLRAELFQREENIKLDPKLDAACVSDQRNLCGNVHPGEGAMLECLKEHKNKLTRECHIAIFQRERLEAESVGLDYSLTLACKSALRQFCPEVEPTRALHCLADHRKEPTMDVRCRTMVQRRLVEQNTDYRLNSQLQHACRMDIAKFCSALVLDKAAESTELQGKVIQCLKAQFVRHQLTKTCEPVVMGIVRDAALDYQLDPVLARACSSEIQSSCKDDRDIEECLKSHFQNRDIKNPDCKKEVARLIHEGKADVQADPILYKACLHDIKHFCHDLTPGQGHLLSCLLTGLESDTIALTEECRTLLSKRVEMFEYAAQVAPVESIRDVVQQIANSPSRNYFVVVAMGVLGIIFVGGLFCGRVTKRLPANIKNK